MVDEMIGLAYETPIRNTAEVGSPNCLLYFKNLRPRIPFLWDTVYGILGYTTAEI